MEVLTPGVKHGQEADSRPQVFRIRGDSEQRLGDCAEEDAVNTPGIVQCQAGDLLRQSKHDVEILYRQQLGFPIGEPLGTGRALTLGTTPVSTRNGEISITCLMVSFF